MIKELEYKTLVENYTYENYSFIFTLLISLILLQKIVPITNIPVTKRKMLIRQKIGRLNYESNQEDATI